MRYLKWVGVAVGGVVTTLVLLIVIISGIGGMTIEKTMDVMVAPVAVPTDPDALERGRHFVESIALCQECHGESLEGQVLGDDRLFGRLAPANLTGGKGGVGGSLTDLDYVRAIRHGVGRGGKAIPFMPSELYNKIGDEDLGAMIAYLRSVPPIDNEVPKSRLRLIARIITVFDQSLLPANLIDYETPRSPAPEPGVTTEYGQYLAMMCTLCHGPDLGGASIPDGSGVRAPNITQGGALGASSEEDFINTLRTGVTPSGNNLDRENMPWDRLSKMTDDELEALWLYVRSVTPLTTGAS